MVALPSGADCIIGARSELVLVYNKPPVELSGLYYMQWPLCAE
jgi:hypothetical protein